MTTPNHPGPGPRPQPQPRALTPGIYVPTLTFFTPTDELDLATAKSHALRLANSGITGLTLQGSNGEAVHLNPTERKTITSTTRSALDANGFAHMPLIVGCGAQSTRETIRLCRDAADAGADYALVLPPSYYRGLVGWEGLRGFYADVARESPVSVLVYNFPGVCAGVDFGSEEVVQLSRISGVVGVKLTCGNTGKLARIVSATKKWEEEERKGSDRPDLASGASERFFTFGGSADFTLQTLVVGGDGVIAGVANLIPKSCVRLMQLFQDGRIDEARKLQGVVAKADEVTIRTGFVGAKAALESFFGYHGCEPRKPCVKLSGEKLDTLKEELKEAVEVEMSI